MNTTRAAFERAARVFMLVVSTRGACDGGLLARGLGFTQFACVGVLALHWLHYQAGADRSDRGADALWGAVFHDVHGLQIRLESALLDRGGLDTNATEVLRLTAALDDVSRSGMGTGEVADA